VPRQTCGWNKVWVRAIPAVLAVGQSSSVSLGAQEEDDLGYVSHVEGTWLVAEDTVNLYRRIQRGDSLAAIADSGVTPSLAVVLTTGQRVRYLCDVPADCSGPLIPADSMRETSALLGFASRIVRAVGSLIEGERPDTVSTISRGGPEIREGVVLIRGDILELEPLIGGLTPRRYRVTIRPLEEGDDAGADRSPVTVLEWDAERETHIAAPGVEPGLYRTEMTRASGLFAPKSVAWMLVAEAGAYEELRDRYAQALEITDGWRGDVSESEVTTFLRTYLQHLSRSAPESEG